MGKLRRLIYIFLLILVMPAWGQSKKTITGTIIGIKDNLYLSNREALYPLDLHNNQFKIRLSNLQAFDYIALATTSGSKIKYLSPKIWIKQDSVNIVFDITNTENAYKTDAITSFQNVSETIENASKRKRKALISEHIKLYPAIFFLYKNKESFKQEELERLFSHIPEMYKQDILVKRIEGYLNAKKRTSPKLKERFQPFVLEDKNQRKVTIEPSASKYRLLAFGTYGCYYSKIAIPLLSELQKEYGEKLDFITMWDTRSSAIWQDKELLSLITWSNLLDKNEFAFTYFDIDLFPTFYLIDKEGKIIGISPINKLRKMLKKKLK